MTTVILAEKPSQARSYVQAFQKSTKKQGYYTVSDPVLPENTLVTYGLGHLVELATPDKYDQKYQQWTLSNLPIFPDKKKRPAPRFLCQIQKKSGDRPLSKKSMQIPPHSGSKPLQLPDPYRNIYIHPDGHRKSHWFPFPQASCMLHTGFHFFHHLPDNTAHHLVSIPKNTPG